MECDEEVQDGSPVGSIGKTHLDSAEESCGDELATAAGSLDEGPLKHDLGDEIPEPKVGMIFETEKVAYDYYTEYGRKVGFCVRWDTRTRSRITGETISRRFLCNKQGFRVDRQKTVDPSAKYHRGETRCGCKAFMRIKLGNDGKFHISELFSTHNHDLIIPQKVAESKIDKKAVLQTAETDYKNFLKTRCENPLQKFEAGLLLDYFMGKQAEDPCFFYSFQLDDEGLISNVFWADGKMRADFLRFGDVICFDKVTVSAHHGQPLAFFIGVNHHVQLAFFGAALMCDETADSLRWVFKTFVNAMFGKMPETVFTDFDEESVDAAGAYLPSSSHRFSAWHLYQAALKHISPGLSGFADFDDDIGKCIFDGDNEAEFLKNWAEMLQKYDLVENSWLQEKFEERVNWAPAYARTTFSADMNNTWRFDSLSNDLDTFLNSEKDDIISFLGQFDKLLTLRRNLELETHRKMIQSLPYAPPIAILQHAARVYTPAVFKMFMSEYSLSLECFIKNRHFDGSIYILTVEDSRHHEHLVTVNLTQEILTCSCHKFEFVGILCGHITNCILHDLRYIPEIYVLKRWTRGGGTIPIVSHAGTSIEEPKPSDLPTRYNSLAQDFALLTLRAAEDEDLHNCALKHKQAMVEEMEKIMKEKTSSVRIISSGSMFGGSQARNNAIGRNFGLGLHFSWSGEAASRNKA
ncbi:protein FAR1-RELATED SEQUENCE 5-like [Wolffia australiana]